MVVSELAKPYHSPSRSGKRLSKITRVLIIFLSVYGVLRNAWADTLPPGTIPNADSLNVISGNVSFVAPEINYSTNNLPNGQILGIVQSSQKAIIEGGQFNIGASSIVNFDHTYDGTGSATLIRIINSFDPTRIEGVLNSPKGQIFLINPNGIIFGGGSTVNVNTLVASSLDINNKIFDDGILSIVSNKPAFIGEVGGGGYVRVEAGAKLNSAIGGKIMLFAPTVSNAGTIKTPDGQTVLAAGDKVYLAISENSNLRGLLVQVDAGGTATNTNEIFANRGNVTIAGMLINQNGTVRATTSVNANGSIKLQASKTKDNSEFVSMEGGDVTLGSNSKTEVLIDTEDKSTVIDSTTVAKSFIEISGSNIYVKDNAWIIAPSGDVGLLAAHNFKDPIISENSTAVANQSHIYFDTSSGIDVSGVGSDVVAPSRIGEEVAQLAVGSNVVLAELRSPELRDSPLQRNGILYTAKVYVDSRTPGISNSSSTVADFSGYLSQIGRGVAQRLAGGGSVNIQSEGDIVFASGASVNVSGGKVEYLGGVVQTTNLIASNGRSYNIATAPRDLEYISIQNISRYEQGYTDGKNAGSVVFSAPAMLLQGNLVGDVTPGLYQDSISTRPVGGSLQIGQNTFNDAGTIKAINYTNVLHSNLVLDIGASSILAPSYDDILLNGLSLGLKQTTLLGRNFVAPSGFSHLKYYADGQVIVKAGSELATAPGGNITINGTGVKVLGHLISHGGTISLQAKYMPGYTGTDALVSNLELGSSSALDVSGIWINDMLGQGYTRTVVINAGNINLSAYTYTGNILSPGGDVYINDGSSLNASGGAWLTNASKLNAGNGGIINIRASGGLDDPLDHVGKIILEGDLRADSLAKGGTLSLTSGSITIGSAALGTNGELLLHPSIFTQGGFSDYKLISYEGMTLISGTVISPVSMNRILSQNYLTQATGTNITSFSNLKLLPAVGQALTRNPTNLSLTASTQSFGNLFLGDGSQINMDPIATLNLDARQQITILGTLVAPSGNISIKLGNEPSSTEVVSYSSSQTVWLGDGSKLDVSAVDETYTNAFGFLSGNVRDAGNITIDALKGTIVAKSNAALNLNGTHAMLDLKQGAGYVRTNEASKGGNLIISAREGLLWDASMQAHGGSDKVASGSFSVSINKTFESSVNSMFEIGDPRRYPVGPRTVFIGSSGTALPNGLLVNDPIGSEYNGLAYIYSDKLVRAGFDSVSIASRDNIRFDQNTTLSTRGEIKLDAPNLIVNQGINATLSSSYIGIGNSRSIFQASYNSADDIGFVREPMTETGSLVVGAQHIDLYGNQSVSASNGATFNSSSDIQLHGVLSTDVSMLTPSGNINAAGDLTFNAARIYPSTLSDFTIKSSGSDSTITFSGNGQDRGVPYSVMGTLNVVADNIYQRGVLRAPFGVINLNAKSELTLASGSLTSLSAEGKTLPFGVTSNGNTWLFDFGDRTKTITTLPAKAINLIGNSVKVQAARNDLSAAKIDIAGGGELMAWEFTTGTGGSSDVLATDRMFAVLPGLNSAYMPGNSESYRDSTIKPGDMVYLSGGNGLAAGNYVLLPGHYALLAGAYSVKVVAGTQDSVPQQNILNSDGSMLVSGYKMQYGGLVADARATQFLVASGTVARTQSEFTETLASDFFKTSDTVPQLNEIRLTNDAGRLSISAINLDFFKGATIEEFKKSLKTVAATNGRGAEVDISSEKIAVTGDATLGGIGYLTLSSEMLNAMEAESLLIGGKRSSVASGTQLDVTASDVDLIGGASLTGKEIILVATDTVFLGPGSSIQASVSEARNNGNLIVGKVAEFDLEGNLKSVAVSGDGALLRVSSGVQRELLRANVTQVKGALNLEGNITNAKSVILDATNSSTLNGSVEMASGGSLSVGAPKISFGTPSELVTNPVGLLFDEERLSKIGSPSSLMLNSYSSLDFYGSVSLGNANLELLSIQGAGVNGYDNASKAVTLTAKTVKFANTLDAGFSSDVSSGTGNIVINAKEIISGSNTFKMKGFSKLTLNANQFTGQGDGGLDVTGDLDINAKRITSSSLSAQTIKASGAMLTASQPAFPTDLEFIGEDPSSLKAAFGAKLTLTADTIKHAGNIEMPAGIVTLKATGSGDSLTLQAGSTISANGFAEKLGTVAVLVDGGKVSLLTTNGNILMESSARVDVSATGGAAAGALVVSSTGEASLLGTLKGGALPGNDVSNPKQGSFEYYASTLTSFADLNALLETNTLLSTGGFNESRNIHVIQGDLTVANTVTSHNFTLTTDDGDITVTAKVDASGNKGGIVNLNAGQKSGSTGNGNVNLAAGSIIDVSATKLATETAGSIGDGGKVTLTASTVSNISPILGSSKITLASDSVINLSGNGLGSDGKLVLRAPRMGIVTSGNSGTGVNLTASISNVNVKGDNATILIEGVKVYGATGNLSLNTLYASTLNANNTSFLTNASTIKTSIGAISDARVLIIAGDEVRSTGSVTIANQMNLGTWASGALTIRAASDINVNESISAGFSNTLNTGTLTSGGNWTYRMIAGSDLQSADVKTTNNGLNGNFTLAADKIIRTGTGEIEISTGGNFSLGSATSVIYTAGELDTESYSSLGNYSSLVYRNCNGNGECSGSIAPVFSNKGGDITIVSKSSIVGAYSRQLPANWMLRQGGRNISTGQPINSGWGYLPQYFNQNIGALGGGNITINASGDISNLSAVVATNGRLFVDPDSKKTLVLNGGGDLAVKANGSIYGGLYMVDEGVATIRAGGGLLAGESISPYEESAPYHTAFAIGHGRVDVQTLGQLNLSTVFNPFVTGVSWSNNSAGSNGYFISYGQDSAVKLTSVASGVSFLGPRGDIYDMYGYSQLADDTGTSSSLSIMPGILNVASLNGDILINSSMAMIPATQRELKLTANGSIKFMQESYLAMSDIRPDSLPSPRLPTQASDFSSDYLTKFSNGIQFHTDKAISVYKDENKPVILYAGKDIVGSGEVSLVLPKKANIFALGDIQDFSVIGQNLTPSDITSIVAGGNFIFKAVTQDLNYISNSKGIVWGGPGYLNITAGKNLTLNNSYGIVTRGNLINPYLSEQGASISILVGASNAKATAEADRYLNHLVQSIFFNDLKQAGIDHNDPASKGFGNYNRGYEAIRTVFGSNSNVGNVDISGSQIKTERGGDLNLMVPAGGVLVGLPKVPPSLIAAKDDAATSYDDSPSLLGLFTVKEGNLNVFSRDSVEVAQSRVFTVGGGDVLIWSTQGNIDAGKGAKTATSAPPPLIRTDSNGNTVVDLAGIVTGSGIGTLQSLGSTSVASVYLIAPSGTVDAGDAGVRSSGNLLVAAQAVANGANMQAGGTSSGVPAPSTANVSFNAPVSADSSNSAKQADKATEAASKSANKTASALPSLITVEVLALGDDAASSSDPEKDEKKKAKKQ